MVTPMPKLDRKIELTVEPAGSRNQFGEWVPGAERTVSVWASYFDVEAEAAPTEAGLLLESYRDFTVRYRNDLAAVRNVARVGVTDDQGLPWQVKSIVELGQPRKRFMRLVCRMDNVNL